ncbi:hypothetical protein SNE40_007040 [Patella caerulea]|uniref:Protein FAN n=2 Tax=Patella caerulea TaxID=87958 RepID=A0AAN8JYU0_PATCE
MNMNLYSVIKLLFIFRFSLLLLEPGEIYFEDFSVYYYPVGLPEAEAIKKKQRGHLKICSKSIVFVPKEIHLPIIKFPMKYVSLIEEWSGGLFSKLDAKDKVLKIESEQMIEMKEKNIIAPFVFRKETAEYIFSLNYATLEDTLPQMCQLQRASTLPKSDQSAMINAIVLSRQSRVKFNTSWLEDLYERIVLESRGDRITPLSTNPGRIMLTSSRLYFQPFNNIDRWPVLKIRLKDITRVIRRRFLLRQLGLEIYCNDKAQLAHLYLSFKTEEDRNDLYEKMLLIPDLELEDWGQEDMALKWQSGHISNYDYLLYLNSMADRSFNDLTQYPVMPWVISDYTSSTLDLNNISTFRDLSKPIGALNSERLERILERYVDMPEPKFMYGSHYSTPGYVLFYLARRAPEYVLCLQNGKFDHPDRMFNDLQDTWNNCLVGAADFKELVPEFYNGEGDFLKHTKVVNFGFRQDGRPVDDVKLPPWADDPADFISKLRQALECDYVSQNLHNWIDLIFGYKQRGLEAEKANNLFYYLTYEGAIDIDSFKDFNERSSMETQIMEFGQTPKQLFMTPHPHRFSSMPIPRSAISQDCKNNNTVTTQPKVNDMPEEPPIELSKSNVKTMSLEDLQNMDIYLQYSLHREAVTDARLSPDTPNIFSVSQDNLLKMYSLEDRRQLRSVNMSSMALSSCIVMPDNKTIVVGSWDNHVYFYSIEYGRVKETLSAHDDAVSSLAWKSNLLYTASWDSTIKIWEYIQDSSTNTFQTPEYMSQLDHDCGVTCFTLDDPVSFLVSGTIDGSLCIWDLSPSHNHYMSNQIPVHQDRINAILISPDRRRILSCGADRLLKVIDTATCTEIFTKDIHSEYLCMNWVGSIAIMGDSVGFINVWDIEKAQQVHRWKAHEGAVMSLDIGQDRCILTGGADKSVKLWKPNI